MPNTHRPKVQRSFYAVPAVSFSRMNCKRHTKFFCLAKFQCKVFRLKKRFCTSQIKGNNTAVFYQIFFCKPHSFHIFFRKLFAAHTAQNQVAMNFASFQPFQSRKNSILLTQTPFTMQLRCKSQLYILHAFFSFFIKNKLYSFCNSFFRLQKGKRKRKAFQKLRKTFARFRHRKQTFQLFVIFKRQSDVLYFRKFFRC